MLDSVRHDQDTTPHYPSESAARRELVPTEGRPNWSPNLLSALTTTAPARIPVPGNVRPTTSPISPIPFTPSRKNKGKKKNIQLQPSWPPVQNHPSRVSSPSQPPPIPVEILTPEPISLMEAISRKPVNFRAIRPDRLASLALSSSGQHYPSESAGSYRKSSLSESSTKPAGFSAVGISSTEIPIRETRPVPKLPPTPSVTPAPAPITAAATPEPSTRHHPIRGVTPGTVVHLP